MALLPSGAALVLLALAALGGGAIALLVLSLPMELPGICVARAGGALGLLMLVGQVGGFLMPLATGAIAGRWGFAAALGLLAVGHAAILIPALGLRGSGRNRAQVAPVAPAQAPSGSWHSRWSCVHQFAWFSCWSPRAPTPTRRAAWAPTAPRACAWPTAPASSALATTPARRPTGAGGRWQHA